MKMDIMQEIKNLQQKRSVIDAIRQEKQEDLTANLPLFLAEQERFNILKKKEIMLLKQENNYLKALKSSKNAISGFNAKTRATTREKHKKNLKILLKALKTCDNEKHEILRIKNFIQAELRQNFLWKRLKGWEYSLILNNFQKYAFSPTNKPKDYIKSNIELLHNRIKQKQANNQPFEREKFTLALFLGIDYKTPLKINVMPEMAYLNQIRV